MQIRPFQYLPLYCSFWKPLKTDSNRLLEEVLIVTWIWCNSCFEHISRSAKIAGVKFFLVAALIPASRESMKYRIDPIVCFLKTSLWGERSSKVLVNRIAFFVLSEIEQVPVAVEWNISDWITDASNDAQP